MRNGIGNQNIVKTSKHGNFASGNGLDFLELDTFVCPKLGDVEAGPLFGFFTKHFDSVTNLYRATENLSTKHSAKVFAVVEVVDLKSERTIVLDSGLGNIGHDCLEQQSHVHVIVSWIEASVSSSARSVKDGEK